MKEGEKDSRDQPKELWIHGRVLLGQWICHSPNAMKTDIFAGDEGGGSGKSTRGSIRFDSQERSFPNDLERVFVGARLGKARSLR